MCGAGEGACVELVRGVGGADEGACVELVRGVC